MNKRSFLKPNIFSSKLLIFNDKIKLTFDNSKKYFSLNKAKVSSKTFDLRFKDSFGFSLQVYQDLILIKIVLLYGFEK